MLWKKLCIGGLLALFPGFVAAQSFDVPSETTLTTNPTHPTPGRDVTATLTDYSGAIFGATISWTVNGDVVTDATNKRDMTFTAGEVGVADTVVATITSATGDTQTLSTTVTPAYLDIVVEPQTRVPTWYAGRSLPSIGSTVNLTALANTGTLVDYQTHVYTWRINGEVLDAGPVRGQYKVSVPTPRGSDFIVDVTVATAEGQVVARRAINIPSVEPTISFYEQHSLYGSKLFPAGRMLPLIGNNIILQAEPFNLDSQTYNNPDIAAWQIDSRDIDNGSNNPYTITIGRSANTGQSRLSFHVRSLQQVLQGDESQVVITY